MNAKEFKEKIIALTKEFEESQGLSVPNVRIEKNLRNKNEYVVSINIDSFNPDDLAKERGFF